MNIRAIIIALLFSVLGTTTRAAELVVMATNTTAVPGAKVFTIGVQVTQADVAAAELKGPPNIPLLVQGVDLSGNILNSQQTNPFNLTELQTLQTIYVDAASYANPVAPGFGGGPPTNLSSVGTHALYATSWWYTGSTGQLMGVHDSSGESGVVSTTPAADGSGIYTVGPTNNIGPDGVVWQATPHSTPSAPGMSLSEAAYGSVGTGVNFLDHSPLGNQFVNGVFTAPLAQVVANGNINFAFSLWAPTIGGNFIAVGQDAVNFLGGDYTVDPHAILDYNTGTIHSQLTSGGGPSSVGGISVAPSAITGNGDLTSTFSTISPADLSQAVGATAAAQVNFALAGPTVQAWDIQYTGTVAGANTVVFHYDPSLIGSTPESELRIEHFENGAWVMPAGQVVDTVAHTITIETDGFSPFVLAQVPVPEPASIVLLALGGVAIGVWRRRR